MNELKNWEVRQSILGCSAEPSTKIGALAILERIDWNTGVKEFKAYPHLNNWLRQTSGIFNLDPREVASAFTWMKDNGWIEIVSDGTAKGFALELSGQGPLTDEELQELELDFRRNGGGLIE